MTSLDDSSRSLVSPESEKSDAASAAPSPTILPPTIFPPATADGPAAPADLLVRVREAIVVILDEGRPVLLAPLARTLGMSSRSLQRRLHERETSLSMLVDDVRRERTLGLLERDPVALRTLVRQAGFSSVPGFFRLFRRWTGTTPRAYQRARLSSRPPPCPVSE